MNALLTWAVTSMFSPPPGTCLLFIAHRGFIQQGNGSLTFLDISRNSCSRICSDGRRYVKTVPLV